MPQEKRPWVPVNGLPQGQHATDTCLGAASRCADGLQGGLNSPTDLADSVAAAGGRPLRVGE